VSWLEGKTETKPLYLKALVGPALTKTNNEGLGTDKFYTRFLRKYPMTVCPTRTMEMEELCSLWTPNVNKWFGGTKECLTHYGYTEDKPIQLVGFSKEGNYYFQWKHLFSVAILLSFSNFLLDFHDATGNLLLDLTFKYAIIYKCIDMYETHHAN
jgi:hypothetical protein